MATAGDKAPANLLDAFWSLGAVDTGARTAAVAALCAALVRAQSDFEDAISAKHGAVAGPGGAPLPPCNDVRYAITRLTRGVCSSNGAARQGYALALCEALTRLPAMATLEVLTQLMKATQMPKRGSREEQRDAQLGRVFGLLALARAGRLPALAGVTVNTDDLDPGLLQALAAVRPAGSPAGGAGGSRRPAGGSIGSGDGDDDVDADGGDDGSEAGDDDAAAADGDGDDDGAAAAAAAAPRDNRRIMPALVLVVRCLLAIGAKKAWLADIAYEAAGAVIAAAGSAAWSTELAGPVSEHLGADASAWSAAQLALVLVLEEAVPAWFPHAEMAWPPAIGALRAALAASTLQRFRAGADDEEGVDTLAAAEVAAGGAKKGDDAGSEAGSDSDSDAGSAGGSAGAGAGGDGEEKLAPTTSAPLAAALLSSTHNYPQMHAVWGHLLQRYVGTGVFPAGAGGRGASLMDVPPPPAALDFVEMWRVYVDELLLPAGPERKATAMALLASVLPQAATAHPAVLAGVLSPMLVSAIVRAAASKRRVLHSPALFALERVRAACTGNSDAASAALVALLARGHPDFDRRTHTTTVAHLLAQLDDAAIARHVAAAAREFVKPSTAPVYSDIASTATGLTGVLRDAEAASARERAAAGDDDDGGEEEVDELVEDDASRARRLSRLSAPERRRLWALDTLVSAVRDPALRVLHSAAEVNRLLALLALHAVADVTIPEALATKLAAGSLDATLAALAAEEKGAGKGAGAASGKKRSRSDVERPQLAALAALYRATVGADAAPPTGAALLGLVADPPLSADLRAEVRTRMFALVRVLSALLSSPPLPRAPDAPPLRGPPPIGPPAAWLGTADRQASLSVAVERLARVMHTTWQAAADAAAALPGGEEATASDTAAVTLSPSPATLATAWSEMAGDEEEEESDEEEDGGEEDGGEEESDASEGAAAEGEGEDAAPAGVLRTQALTVSDALRAASATLLAANAAVHAQLPAGHAAAALAPQQRALSGLLLDGGRALAAFGQLHTVVAGTMLMDAANPGGGAMEVGLALSDLLRCTPGLLRTMLAPLVAALGAATAPPTAASSAGAPTPARRGKGAAAAAAAATAPHAAPLPAVTAAAAAVTALYDTLVRATGGAPASAAVAEVEVFTDVCLALAANSALVLRDAIKAAARFAFAVITPDCVSTMLGVVVERKRDLPTAGSDDEEGDEDDEDDSDDDAGSDDGGKAKKKQPAAAKHTHDASDDDASESEDDDDDDGKEEDASDGDDDDDDDDEDEEEEEEEEEEGGAGGEMSRYDSMLGAMIRARKDGKSAAKQAKLRETEFKFRALELLDVAISRLAYGPGGCAHAAMLSLPLPLLDAVAVLSRRAAPKVETPATLLVADEAAKLLARVMALLTAVTKTRLLVAHAGAPPPAAGVALPATDVLTVFDDVVMSASEADAPTRAYGEACTLVTTFVLRSLHVRAAPAAGGGAAAVAAAAAAAAAGAAVPGNSQPGAEYVEHLAGGYAAIAKKYLSEKHTHVNANLFRGVLAQVPVVAVRLLPTLSGLVSTGAITKAFKLAEAFDFMTTVVKAATAVWALAMPCAVGEDGAGTVTVGDYLAGVVPGVVAATAGVLKTCVAAGASSSGGDSDAARAPLIAKQLREPLTLLAALFQRHLVRAGNGAAEAALDAAAALAARVSSGVVATAAAGALVAGGRAAPAGAGAAGGAARAAGGDDTDRRDRKRAKKARKDERRAARAAAAAAEAGAAAPAAKAAPHGKGGAGSKPAKPSGSKSSSGGDKKVAVAPVASPPAPAPAAAKKEGHAAKKPRPAA